MRVRSRIFPLGRLLAVLALVHLGLGAAEARHERSTADDGLLLLAREAVAAHNLVRSKIGIPPLVWSDQIAGWAQDWANTLLSSGELAHRGDRQYGENLYEASGFRPTAYQVVNAWAAEARNYQYGSNSCSAICGHYTQVIWRDTKAVGCGVARDAKREIWVCNYAPFGNIVGERPY